MTEARPNPSSGGGLAVLTAVVQAVGSALWYGAGLDLLGYVLLVLSGLMLAGRLTHPVISLSLVTALTTAYYLLGYTHGPAFLAVVIGVLSAKRWSHNHLVSVLTVLAFLSWVVATGPTLREALIVVIWIVVLGLIAEIAIAIARFMARMAREQRRLYTERQRRQASEERLRIANELHDVVGHHLSLINVRAGVGLHLMDRQPEQARAALETVRQASAEALREVQSVISALRPAGEAAPRTPAPGLHRLPDLTVDAGIAVTTTIRGEARELPPDIDRAAYRIIQEALTNVRRHAGSGAAATITIDYKQPEQVVIQIDDDGSFDSAPAPDGNGISGMRERATALGGTLAAQPLPGGGWQVRAVLPLGAPS